MRMDLNFLDVVRHLIRCTGIQVPILQTRISYM